jgi:hypothetical protein
MDSPVATVNVGRRRIALALAAAALLPAALWTSSRLLSATPTGHSTTHTSRTLADIRLTKDTRTLDTGAAGIAGGYDVLTVYIIARTNDVGGGDGTHGGTLVPIYVTVDGDTSASYDLSYIVEGGYGTFGHGVLRAKKSWEMTAHGSGGTGKYPAVNRLTIPDYASSAFAKVGEATTASPDGMSDLDNETVVKSLGWRGTRPITRLTVTTGGKNKLKAGSRLLIIGT